MFFIQILFSFVRQRQKSPGGAWINTVRRRRDPLSSYSYDDSQKQSQFFATCQTKHLRSQMANSIRNVLVLLFLATLTEIIDSTSEYKRFYEFFFLLFDSVVTDYPDAKNNQVSGFLKAAAFPYQGRRRCPLCDSSVYGYCSDKLFHDSCCCHQPHGPYGIIFFLCFFLYFFVLFLLIFLCLFSSSIYLFFVYDFISFFQISSHSNANTQIAASSTPTPALNTNWSQPAVAQITAFTKSSLLFLKSE